MTLLDPAALAHAEQLGLFARHVVEGYLAGEHKSPFHGFATEFAEHREYAQGDDLRHLDWKLLGRTDRYYIKQYEQETNFVAHLLVDGSESMRYGSGTPTKLQYARQLAACLAYLILHQRDAVAVGLFDAALKAHLPRSNSRATLNTIMNQLAAFDPGAGTNVGGVLHEMAAQTPRRGLMLVVSDFFDDEDAVIAGLQHLRFIGHEVVCFHVLDAAELEFPFDGNVEFVGLEGIAPLQTRAHELRRAYLAELGAFRQRLRAGCDRNQAHYVEVNTTRPLREVLGNYLAFRLRTRRRRG
ncbi:MAG TPA: DUF58 domain-containing protein [Verrucomicrobiota bacterium]|nr:DUF58 domain-containing protein [Verrucomicrobiota bacterium]